MKIRSKGTAVAIVAVAALGIGGAAIAGAAGDSDPGEDDRPIQGQALERAGAAALAETGGGKVTDTEVGDEEGAYEVEVTRDDGSQVDIHLDEDFQVLGSESDGDEDED